MGPTPNSLDAKIHITANNVILDALVGAPKTQKRTLVTDGVVVKRTRGRYGSGTGAYEFGNRYSVPAIVVDGEIKRLA